MNDKEWMKSLDEIDTAEGILRVIVEREGLLGYDPYYGDLRNAMLDAAARILSAVPEAPGLRGRDESE